MGMLALASFSTHGAIFWPGGGTGGNDKEADFQQGYTTGQEDCRTTPQECGVKLYQMVKDQGYGETEPNDHLYNADGLLPGIFYHANSRNQYDQDWFYLTTDRRNQKLTVSFLGDPENFADTAGWEVRIRDLKGNVIAAFDSETAGQPSPVEGGDNISPVELAKIIEVTLSKIGTYYISVRSRGEDGMLRGYHIAAMLEDTGQITADHDDAPFDTETEPNDDNANADVLRSNVAMVGVFDRTLVKKTKVTTPAETEIKYFYKGCSESNPSTIPFGNTDCQCDMTKVSPGGNAYVDPANQNITDPPPADCEANVDGGSPDDACKRETACEARRVTTPEKTEWRGIFHYDKDVYVYHSEGDEQLRIQICTRTECEFGKVHLKVHKGNVVLMDSPIEPGQVIDLGVAFPGDYYFVFSPEETGVDSETGDPEVEDLVGPYDLLLMSTRFSPSGDTVPTSNNPVQKPKSKPKDDNKKKDTPKQDTNDDDLNDLLKGLLGG